MPTKKQALPRGYGTIMAYLAVDGAADAIAFYKTAFGAKERFRLAMGPKVGHAELDIGGSVVMLADVFPEMGGRDPKGLGGTPVTLALMVGSCDATLAKAVAAGATVKRPATDEFYGYRSAQVEDPFGHRWMIQQMIEEVPPKEMQKRLDRMMTEMAAGKGHGAKAPAAARKRKG